MDNPSPQQVASRIDADRAQAGLSVNALAKESGIPLTTLQRRLDGDGQLTLTELQRLSGRLGVPVSSWLGVAA